MTDPLDLVSKFKENMDSLVYPQSVVGGAISASAVTLNSWRRDDIILPFSWERKGQVMFSGRGVLHTAIINDLAWAIGPTRAKAISDAFLDKLDNFDTEYRGYNLVIHQPSGGNAPIDGSKLDDGELPLGMLWYIQPTDTDCSNHRSYLTSPIFEVLINAAWGAQKRLEAFGV